jgi:hypothetical protein
MIRPFVDAMARLTLGAPSLDAVVAMFGMALAAGIALALLLCWIAFRIVHGQTRFRFLTVALSAVIAGGIGTSGGAMIGKMLTTEYRTTSIALYLAPIPVCIAALAALFAILARASKPL